jgi:hypothetical protein
MGNQREPVANCFEAVDKYNYEDFDTMFEYLHESSSAPIEDDAPPEECIGNWTTVKNFDCNVDVNTIDSLLLNQAKKEIPIVIKRILKQHDPDVDLGDWIKYIQSLEPIDLFAVWIGLSKGHKGMSRPLFSTMQTWVQKYMRQLKNYQGNPTISIWELVMFIEAELLMSFYKCSPKQYFSNKLRKRYPRAQTGISKHRYKLVMWALSKSEHMKHDYEDELEWSAPNESDSSMARVVESFHNFCARIAFIKNVSWVCFDDDLLRHRSRIIPNFGYSQINNPAKGMGVIHHAAVGVVTCLYLGGHIPSFGETTFECVKLIQMALVGLATIGQLVLRGILFFWDRGYGGTEGKVNTSTIEAGANIVTTCQWQQSFPFTYGQNAGPSRQLIQELGAPSCYWASKEVKSKEGDKNQYALAYRNGLNHVVLMSTTIPQCGPGQYTFITKSHSYEAMRGEWVCDDADNEPESENDNIDDDDNDDNNDDDNDDNEYDDESDMENDNHFAFSSNSEKEENRRNIKQIWELFESMIVSPLTSAQRCPEWFLLQQFRITGTSAYSIWKIGKEILELDCNPVLKAMGLMSHSLDGNDNDDTSDASDELAASKKKTKNKPSVKENRPPEFLLTVNEIKNRLKTMGKPIGNLIRIQTLNQMTVPRKMMKILASTIPMTSRICSKAIAHEFEITSQKNF